jgi:SAM-dependent methyltransferase
MSGYRGASTPDVPDLDDLDLDDVYSAEYTSHIETIRHEAALILARIAMRQLFANGPVRLDPAEPVPESAAQRQPMLFRRRLIAYLSDRGDLLDDHRRLVPSPQLIERAATPENEYFRGAAVTPTLHAMKCIEAVAGGVLSGKDGLVLLEERFGSEETWRIWQYLMVDAAPKKSCNSLVARALDLRLRSGRPIVVFEGGAGVGASLREALAIDGFRQRAGLITTYGFTDVSRPLMRRARDMLHEAAPELLAQMRFDRVDLDALDEYDDVSYLQESAADIVIFESVLHDVQDLHGVLVAARRVLKPGGWLAFTIGSRGRPGMFFPCELLQSTLHSYYRARLDPPRRINVGYLSIWEWKASLESAGFTEFRIFPNVEDHEKWPYGGIVARRS